MTTRRWFEFVSTRYRSSGSICPRPSFCVSPSPSPTCFLSLRRARYLDSPASFSVALCRSRFFFVPRFVPDTRRADPLHYPLPSLPRAPRPLATAASVHVLRPSGCFPRPISLDLSIHLPLVHASTAYQSVSVPRSVSAFSHRFSRTPSRSRRGASLALSFAVAPLAGPLSVESLCARQAGHGEVKQAEEQEVQEEEEEQEEQEEEEGEASSRSIAKHWAELVYRRIEGERG